jgi:hypothetical protein
MAYLSINSDDFKDAHFDKQFLKIVLIGGAFLGFAYVIFINYI